ncbi:TetR/AcrR family transcriptional regulator [Paenibacillus hubeiensis]|uniref:TetR/AcrR family transcriptional regulator n=1 Tax=Paenibacillus hubeiensis TaxID=3077330 RepID=UPI0031BB8E14
MSETWHQHLKNKNRDELIAAGRALFLKHGFLRVNIKDVCNAAGISRVTFYKHFQTIDELLFEVQMQLMEDLTDNVTRAASPEWSGRQQLAAMLDAWVQYAWQHPEHIRYILLFDLHYEAYDSNTELKSRYDLFVNEGKERHFLMNALTTGIADGTLKPDPAPLDTAHFIFTSMMGMLQKMSLGQAARQNPKDLHMTKQFACMLLQYVSADSHS